MDSRQIDLLRYGGLDMKKDRAIDRLNYEHSNTLDKSRRTEKIVVLDFGGI